MFLFIKVGDRINFSVSSLQVRVLDLTKYKYLYWYTCPIVLVSLCNSSHISLIVNYPGQYTDPHFSLYPRGMKGMIQLGGRFGFQFSAFLWYNYFSPCTRNSYIVEYGVMGARSKICTNVWGSCTYEGLYFLLYLLVPESTVIRVAEPYINFWFWFRTCILQKKTFWHWSWAFNGLFYCPVRPSALHTRTWWIP